MRRLWVCLIVVCGLLVGPALVEWRPTLPPGRAVIQQIGSFFVPVLRAAATFVDSCIHDDGDTDSACTLTGVQAGDSIIAFGRVDGNSGGITITDDKSDVFSDPDDQTTAPSLNVAYDVSVAGGDTLVTATAGANFVGVCAIAIRGLSAFDALATTNTGTSASAANTGVALSAAGIALSGFNVRGGGTIGVNNTGTSPATWTQAEEQETYTNTAGGCAYKTGGADTYTHVWSNPNADWRATGITFTESGGAGTPVCTRSLLGVGC